MKSISLDVVQDKILAIFNNIQPLGQELTDEIRLHGKLTRSEKKCDLLQFHQINKSIHFILSGCVRVYCINDKGEEHTSWLLTEGDLAISISTYTWITGTKNAVGSAVGEEVPATRRSHASYTVTVDERTFRNVCNTSACKGASQYDLNNYNCIACAIDVFNAALPSTKPFSVADSPIGFTTPAGLYGRLNQINSAGVSGVSMNQANAPVNSSPCN
ncbi:MAG: cyclic nucleotide-binding domain-containing protein [Sphingobacterium sp.]|uniref:cyclic nucleotide-binding domain-containing protein n=1 Tax=Sphingobacterium sp. JB170 TaxID=1434842 RepID=UPI000B34B574|nr:cyclic nucleotide-binding domain-containing protein [Sphingobacterium sp. JB170]